MRFTTALLILFTSSILGACGGADDVEINLPFVGDIMAKTKGKEAKMANRGTLVLPPTVTGLPAPTSKQQAANSGNWPVDPDLKAKNEAAIAAAKEREYQRNGDWKGERKTGNGLEDFKDKTDWSRRQSGIFKDILNNPANRE